MSSASVVLIGNARSHFPPSGLLGPLLALDFFYVTEGGRSPPSSFLNCLLNAAALSFAQHTLAQCVDVAISTQLLQLVILGACSESAYQTHSCRVMEDIHSVVSLSHSA